MYVLLSGNLPFPGNNDEEIFQNILSGRCVLTGKPWSSISTSAKNLITKLLNKDPTARLSTEKALSHTWFTTTLSDVVIPADPEILRALQNYKVKCRIQREALSIIVKYLNFKELKELKEAFLSLDKTQSGYLTYEELEEALKANGSAFAGNQIAQIVENADFRCDGRINYSEFLAATLISRKKLDKEWIWLAFKHFDTDKTGVITAENLKEALRYSGRIVSRKSCRGMIREVKQKGNAIQFKEFKALFF